MGVRLPGKGMGVVFFFKLKKIAWLLQVISDKASPVARDTSDVART